MQTFKKLIFFLKPNERKEAILLVIMITFVALLDMIGVASIMPFIAVLSNPEIVEKNLILNSIFKNFGFGNIENFILILGILVLSLLFISLFFKSLVTYFQIRFAQMCQYSISKRLVEEFLQKPYTWSLNKNSSEISKDILDEVGMVVGSGIFEILQIIAKSSIVIFIIILLILVDPKLAFLSAAVLFFCYGLIYFILRKYLNKIAKQRFIANELRFKVVSEAFSATRDVKLKGLEQTFVKHFSKHAKIYAKTVSNAEIIKQLPRFVLEAIIFGGIMLIMLYLISKTGSFDKSIPILSLYVFAGYRLMPAFQQCYVSLTQLSFANPAIEKLYKEIKNFKSHNSSNDQEVMLFNKSINLKNMYYTYPNRTHATLKNINLSISANTTVGFIGTTGSGKTTIVDIILGLLEPNMGTLEVDGKIITKQNSRSWQRNIGYVPQNIFLSDDTIAANIAFGVEPEAIKYGAIEKASKIANLHEFVSNELPLKYETKIGERGVRLSGGQRQRIGVARALYQNPNILILDEATSALDNQTEQAVMDAINNLNRKMTIIIIAHRLNTVKNCDNIFFISKGELKEKGSYHELKKNNPSFFESAITRIKE